MNKKKIIVITAIVLAVVIGLSLFFTLRTSKEENSSLTKLYVSNYDGGYGNEWLHKVEKRFEEDYADWVNPVTGKVGVDIVVEEGNKTTGITWFKKIK